MEINYQLSQVQEPCAPKGPEHNGILFPILQFMGNLKANRDMGWESCFVTSVDIKSSASQSKRFDLNSFTELHESNDGVHPGNDPPLSMAFTLLLAGKLSQCLPRNDSMLPTLRFPLLTVNWKPLQQQKDSGFPGAPVIEIGFIHLFSNHISLLKRLEMGNKLPR
jgi:hypothetical protein